MLLLSNKRCYPYSLQFCYENIVYLLNSFTRRKYLFAQNLQCMKGGQVVEWSRHDTGDLISIEWTMWKQKLNIYTFISHFKKDTLKTVLQSLERKIKISMCLFTFTDETTTSGEVTLRLKNHIQYKYNEINVCWFWRKKQQDYY